MEPGIGAGAAGEPRWERQVRTTAGGGSEPPDRFDPPAYTEM